jgi:phosphate transport system ATP-binding protein
MTALIDVRGLSAWHGPTQVLHDVHLTIEEHEILGVIGPAGAGKSTFLRSLNRMNDLTVGCRTQGVISYQGIDISDRAIDTAALRRRFGMVFAVPVPLPGSIRQNLTLGPAFVGQQGDHAARIESTLKAACLWDEVKDRLDMPAPSLSGGQQQRLCLARALMLDPEVLLLDEPCSGLDPISTSRIEEALQDLKVRLTVVLVTNNVMQASRAADRVAFFNGGRLVECGTSKQIFVNPREKETHDYISGRFG